MAADQPSGRGPVKTEPVPWPDGARCACSITFDVDSDSLIHVAHPHDAHRRAAAQSWLQYDRVAIPRILETYRELGLRQTFFFPGWCIERYPELAEAVVAAGHELGLHGYLHERASELEPAEERRTIERALEAADRLGVRVAGWRAPFYSFSDQTASLLVEYGFRYHSGLMGDDVPYLLKTPLGNLIEIPTVWAMDDWPQYVQTIDLDYLMPIRAPKHAVEVFEAELTAMREVGGVWVATWHPFVSGRPAQWHAAVGLLERIMAMSDAWLASLAEIAEHIATSAAEGTYRPRIDDFPYYDAPVRAVSEPTPAA